MAQAFCSSSAASPSRILGTNQGLNVHLVEAAGIPPASAVAVVAQLTRLQAVQHCWMKHRSCLHGCAGCAALLDEAFSRALIGRCAVPVAGRRAEGIEPSDAMATTTWLSILVCFVCFALECWSHCWSCHAAIPAFCRCVIDVPLSNVGDAMLFSCAMLSFVMLGHCFMWSLQRCIISLVHCGTAAAAATGLPRSVRRT